MLYEIAIRLLGSGMRLAALFHPKAAKWVEGRRNWRARYREVFDKKGRLLWVHAASLGEFEQGRPVIEEFRQQFPGWQIVLRFFSPSGYEIRKDYPHADFICYLPLDTRRNAQDFLDLIRPDAAVFVKYEFWSNYLRALQKRRTPVVLISALFRPGQPFFRWYGGFWRQMLRCFSHIFVQNNQSARLLQEIGLQAKVTVAGDTRVDRVLRIAASAPENPVLARFAASPAPVLIAGSTWPADEAALSSVLFLPDFQHYKIVWAPHEPTAEQVERLEKRLSPELVVRYSQAAEKAVESARHLIIDNIGLLNTLYRYGRIAYIGGGFGRGIHNTLEPAAWGLPVIFGPKYGKFEEARQLVARGGAFSVGDPESLAGVLQRLGKPAAWQKASETVGAYMAESKGATRSVLEYWVARLPK